MKKEISNKKISGYTLVEMVVVMGIFALLASLGAGAWISVRRQSQVDEAVQLYITLVREAQNKAFAVEKASGQETKVWTIQITDNTNNIGKTSYYYVSPSSSLSVNAVSNTSISPVTVRTNGPTYNYVSFSLPFGKGYVHNTLATSGWSTSTVAQDRPAGDFVLNSPVNTPSYVDFNLSGYSRRVIIEPNGDVYAQ